MATNYGNKQVAGYDILENDVVGAGLCTACGTCVGVCPTNSIEFDYEREEPVLRGECKPCGTCCAVCPGKDIPLPGLERMLFSRERKVGKELLGVTRRQLKGYAIDPVIRKTGASGGCTTALLTYALETGIIDGAIVAGMSSKKPWRAEPKLATTRAEILEGAQSKYTVVPNNALLREAEQRGIRKLGIVGLPCHVHGLRKIQMHGKPKGISNRIHLIIGVFCGSNFSHKVTEFLIKKFTGISLEDIRNFTDRGGPESQDLEVTSYDGITKTVSVAKYGFDRFRMRRDRCTMCLDFTAELADISLGDIFLPMGVTKLPGISTMLVRTDQGEALVDGARKSGYITSSPLKHCGFRHNLGYELKNRVAPYYLLDRRRFGWPTPDFHYEPYCEPPEFIDEKEAILEQMHDIPEVVEWIAQNPAYQQVLENVDPGILKVMEKLRSSKSSDS